MNYLMIIKLTLLLVVTFKLVQSELHNVYRFYRTANESGYELCFE